MLIRSFLRRLSLAAAFASAAAGQSVDTALFGAFGGVSGEGASTAAGGVGASVRLPSSSGHAIQGSYFFTKLDGAVFDTHFVTASYVRQAKAGRARPFLQAGAGVEIRRLDLSRFDIPPEASGRVSATRTDFALTIGGGASISLGKRFFIRPQLRAYLVVGPNLVLLPGVAIGWRHGSK